MPLAAAHPGAYKPTKPLALTPARLLVPSRTLLHSSSQEPDDVEKPRIAWAFHLLLGFIPPGSNTIESSRERTG